MMPFGVCALAAASVVRTWSRLTFIDSSTRGFSSTRTAGLAPPPTVTWPTPCTCEAICAPSPPIRSSRKNSRRCGEDAVPLHRPRSNLREDRIGGVVHLAGGVAVRGERKDQDRRVGRVDFAIGGI